MTKKKQYTLADDLLSILSEEDKEYRILKKLIKKTDSESARIAGFKLAYWMISKIPQSHQIVIDCQDAIKSYAEGKGNKDNLRDAIISTEDFQCVNIDAAYSICISAYFDFRHAFLTDAVIEVGKISEKNMHQWCKEVAKELIEIMENEKTQELPK